MKIFTSEDAGDLFDAISYIKSRKDKHLSDGKILFQCDFISPIKANLEILSEIIVADGKTIKYLREADPSIYMLRVFLEEKHTIASLVVRVRELNELSQSVGVGGLDEISVCVVPE